MKLRWTRANRLTIGLWLIATALVSLVLVGSAPGGGTHERHRQCTHGLSSIGPIVIVNGKVVSGPATPHTQACLH
jgi:hypothetical protein